MSEIKSNTKEVLKTATTIMGLSVTNVCEIMGMKAKQLSPWEYGHNSNSIAVDIKKENKKTVGRVFTQTNYGGWLEIGTTKMPARPYFAPAFSYAIAKVQARRNKFK